MSILQLRKEIDELKKNDEFAEKLTQTKLDAIKSEMSVQNSWITGILIVIFGSVLAIAIPPLLSKRNTLN